MFICPQIDEREVLVQHRIFERALDQWSTLAVKTAEEHAKAHVKLYSKFKRRRSQGSLKDAALARHRGTWRSNKIQVEVYVNSPRYAPYIEAGTRAHPIVADNARALRFDWKRQGRDVFITTYSMTKFGTGHGFLRKNPMFFRSVQHPGTKPYKFLYNATRSAYRVFGDAMRNSLDQAAKKF